MEDWLKKVKNHWNSVSDSEWYMSLRTDEKIRRLQENPASAFHPAGIIMRLLPLRLWVLK